MVINIDYFSSLINVDYLIRISMAVVFGFSLGLERELTNKYAGLRTHILVCLGACIFTLISIYGFPTFAPGDNVIVSNATGVRDTSRVAAQIVTGIGFIGAGTVLRNGPIVLGLTTAATLWIAACIGMACGAGMLDVAFLGSVMAILTLVIIRIFERKVLPKSTKLAKKLKVTITCKEEFADEIHKYIIEKYPNVSELSKKPSKTNDTLIKVSCIVEIIARKPVKELYKALQNLKGVNSISIQDSYE